MASLPFFFICSTYRLASQEACVTRIVSTRYQEQHSLRPMYSTRAVFSRLFLPGMCILIVFGALAKPRAGISCTNGMSSQNPPALRKRIILMFEPAVIIGGSFAGCLRCTQASMTTAPPCRLLELGPLQSVEAQTGRCQGQHRIFRFRCSGARDGCSDLSYLCLQFDAHFSRLLYRSISFLDVPKSITIKAASVSPDTTSSARNHHTKKGSQTRRVTQGKTFIRTAPLCLRSAQE